MAEDRDTAVDRLRQIRGVRWRWRSTAPRRARRSPEIGVIAQEVERVFPELVSTDWRGHQRVAYIGLVGPLIEAVKELDARVQALELERGVAGSAPDTQEHSDT
jgi:hypothetical protein